MTPKLPDWTWQLEAGDMCKGAEQKRHRRCLEGWCRHYAISAFDELPGNLTCEYDLACFISNVVGLDHALYLAEYNDTHTLDHNARVWNTTMKRLGYDMDEESCL